MHGWSQFVGAEQGRLGQPHRVAGSALQIGALAQSGEDVRAECPVTAEVSTPQRGYVEALTEAVVAAIEGHCAGDAGQFGGGRV